MATLIVTAGALLIPISSAWTRYLSAFSAGVFLSVALVHALPDAAEQYHSNFPFAHFCAAIGFLLLWCVEQLHALPIPSRQSDAVVAIATRASQLNVCLTDGSDFPLIHNTATICLSLRRTR